MSDASRTVTFTFDGQEVKCQRGETVLEALERAGIKHPSGCRNGQCWSCKCYVDSPDKAVSQSKLPEKMKKQGALLACTYHVDEPTTLFSLPPETLAEHALEGIIQNVQHLTDEILELTVACEKNIEGRPGQFVQMKREDGLTRTYSIAEISKEETKLRFHIREIPNGKMSSWLAHEDVSGNPVHLSEPQGECHYGRTRQDQPLLLIGTGSGAAPLYGILQEALAAKHREEIWFFHGSRNPSGLYLDTPLHKLTQEHSNLHYYGCLSGEENLAGTHQGRVESVAFSTLSSLTGFAVFLCGHPEMVKNAKKKAYLSGASLDEIYCDPFVAS
ncbi:MAG: 2Fe-2S iron-sulfur cluster binding domain-containing protein [Bdellovibrionales bacterium]|nr:2Fe-2S iron-sulfur cluster binding domain-containing protein [Bdellovibrionales bacterium]